MNPCAGPIRKSVGVRGGQRPFQNRIGLLLAARHVAQQQELARAGAVRAQILDAGLVVGGDLDLLQRPVEYFQIVERADMLRDRAPLLAAGLCRPIRHGMMADKILDQFPFPVLKPRAGDMGQTVPFRPLDICESFG